MLFVWPADDAEAEDLREWGRELEQHAPGTTATADGITSRDGLEVLLATHGPTMLWFGHGRRDALLSHGTALVDELNADILAGGAVVAVACEAADMLGRTATGSAGATGFLGFDALLAWPPYDPVPIRDGVVLGLRCLLAEGHDLACAADELRDGFLRAEQHHHYQVTQTGSVDVHGAPSHALLALLLARSNRLAVTVHGDSHATL